MSFITATATNCLVRTAPSILASKKQYLEYGKVYPATLQGDWYHIPSIPGYSHKTVVREVPDPAIPRPAAPPIYLSQWALEANARQNDCGPACVAMHLRARGDMTPINQLRTKEPTGLTDAPELQNILAAHNVVSVIDRADPNLPLHLAAKPYSLLLVNYAPIRQYAQDIRFQGWHWLIYLGLDPTDPNFCFVHDPDYWAPRQNEGNRKRYPTAAVRAAFRPYPGNNLTTALVIPDLLVVTEPVWTPRFVDSPFPLGINVRSGPAITTPKIGNGFGNSDPVFVDLNSAPGTGYVLEQRGGYVALQYLATVPPTPKPGVVMTSPTIKAGWHVTYDTDIHKVLLPYAERMRGKIAGFVVVSMPELANQLVAMGYTVMYRQFFEADQTFKTDWLNNKTPEQAWQIGYDLYYGAHYASTQLLDRRIFVNLTNEVGYHPLDYAFTQGIIAAANKDNRKVAVFGDSYGSPEVEQWKTRIPALRDAMAGGHAVKLNQYGRCEKDAQGDCIPANYPVSDDEAYESFGGRFELFYDAVPADCRPYLITGETGPSNSAINHSFVVDDNIKYGDRVAASKYGYLVLFHAYYTLGLWEENNLVGYLPESETKLQGKPNPPMFGPGTIPVPIPPTPTPQPPPAPTGYKFPFAATIRGIHGNAGGWQPNPAELAVVRDNKIELLFIVAYESGQAAPTIQFMRQAGIKRFVLRAAHRGNWSDFANGSLPRLQEYASALGSSQNLEIQIHNEPNLTSEGLNAGWRNGVDFADWWLKVAAVYRAKLPGCKLGFPALSPGGDISGIRLAESTFAVQAVKAVQAADWIGVHYYWNNPDGSDIAPPVAFWRSLYGNKPLLGTEIGPVNAVSITAAAARKAYEKFGAAGVPICQWLLNSPTNDFAGQSWVRQNIVI